MSVTTAIILAGGKGTRLRSVIEDLPKPMAPVNGKPFLSLMLDHLVTQAITHVILAVGHLHHKVSDQYGEQYESLKISYSIEDSPLGTGGAIKKALDLCEEENCLVLNGDSYTDFQLKPLAEFYDFMDNAPVLLLKKMRDFDRYGAVDLEDDFSVKGFSEKKYCKEGYINAGVYLINKNIFRGHFEARFSFEQEILEGHSSNVTWYGYPQDVYFKDIGIPDDYSSFIKDEDSNLINWKFTVDPSWTIFVDRDGVINIRKIGGYIEKVEEFLFLPGTVEKMVELSTSFERVIVITNQQGIGKGIFTEEKLAEIHTHMISEIEKAGGSISKVYFCPDLASQGSKFRKPNTGMGLCAKTDYPDLNFARSIMIGDSPSDMEFGKRLGMHCVAIGERVLDEEGIWQYCDSLYHFDPFLED